MKKIYTFLLMSCLLATVLLSQASAADSAGFVSGSFQVLRYQIGSGYYGYTYTFGNSYGSEPYNFQVAGSEDISLTYSFSYEALDNPDGKYDYIVSSYLVFNTMSNSMEILPSSVIINNGKSTETTVTLSNSGIYEEITSAGTRVMCSNSITERPMSYQGGITYYNDYIKILIIDMIISAADNIDSLTFNFECDSTNNGFYTHSTNSTVYAESPISIILSGDANYDEVVALLNKINIASLSNSYAIGTKLYGAVNDMSSSMQSSLDAQTSTYTASMEQLREAVNQMSEGMEEEVASGMEKFFNELKQEAVDVANDTVASIQEQFNVDVSSYTNAMNTLYTSVSTHSDNANMTFPAGTVTLMGEQLSFWDETEIDFNSFFEMPAIQLILLPIRFVIYFGFGYYVFKWVGKLEDLITMNKSE